MGSQRSSFSRSSEGPWYSRTSSSYELSRSNELFRSNELSARKIHVNRVLRFVFLSSDSIPLIDRSCRRSFLVSRRCFDDSSLLRRFLRLNLESVLEESARSSYETRIRPLTYVSVDRAPIRPNRLERNFSLVNLICLFVALRFMSEKHVGKSPPPGRSASTSRSRSS